MRQIINIGLILSFQLCYLEWPNNASFIFQAEYEIFTKTEQLIKNFMHPIILIGLLLKLLFYLQLSLKILILD